MALANFNALSVDVIDTATNRRVANIPVNRVFGVALSPDMTRVYAASSTGDATLDPGESCTVQLDFIPRTTGVHAAPLDIFSNAAGSPHPVDLSGTGCAIPTASRARVRRLLCGP